MKLLLLLFVGVLAQVEDDAPTFERRFDEDGKRIPLTDEEKALRKAAAQERGRGNRVPKDNNEAFQCQNIEVGECSVSESGGDNEDDCAQAVMDNDSYIGYVFYEVMGMCDLLTREQWTCINDAQIANEAEKVCRDKSEAKKDRPLKIDKASVMNAIKKDLRSKENKAAIKQMDDLEDREDHIFARISLYLDNDNERDNTPENRQLIYDTLMKKKETTDDGFFQKIDNYTVQQVDQMREEELERLFREEKQKFLDQVNPKHDGPDFTIDGESPNGYADAVALVAEAKHAARAQLKEAKGEGKLTRQGESVQKKDKAKKKAKHAAKSFDRKSKYGKWQKQHDKKGLRIEQQQTVLDREFEAIKKACQRIKIDLRREGVEEDKQLDEFVMRLAQRGLEDWAPEVIFKNASGKVTCGSNKISDYYNKENAKISTKRQENLDAAAIAETTWAATVHKDNAEGETETNAEKRIRLQNAAALAKQEYEDAVAAETADRDRKKGLIMSGLAEIKPPRKNALREKAKNKFNRKQGKQRVQFTP